MFPAGPNAQDFVLHVKALKEDAGTIRVRDTVVGAVVDSNGTLDIISDLVQMFKARQNC